MYLLLVQIFKMYLHCHMDQTKQKMLRPKDLVISSRRHNRPMYKLGGSRICVFQFTMQNCILNSKLFQNSAFLLFCSDFSDQHNACQKLACYIKNTFSTEIIHVLRNDLENVTSQKLIYQGTKMLL